MADIIYRQTSADPGRVASSVKNLPLSNVEVDGNFKEIDLELATKAAALNAALTGTPTAPTAATATNTTQIATTAYVVARVAQDAPAKNGTGATGTWGISISGSSDSCTGNAANVTGIVPVLNGGTGNTTGAAASATTAGAATNVAIINDVATNASVYPVWVTANTGNMPAKTSSTKLSFNPSSGVLNATTFDSTSDANLKTNIVPLADSLAIIEQLNGVSFDWKDGTGSSYGMIAQEVEPVLPFAVSDNGVHKSINYSAVIPFLIESIKELQARIVLLENK